MKTACHTLCSRFWEMHLNIYFLNLSRNVLNNSLAFIGSSGGDFIKSGFREAHKRISADLGSLEDFSTISSRWAFPASHGQLWAAVMCVFFVCFEALATVSVFFSIVSLEPSSCCCFCADNRAKQYSVSYLCRRIKSARRFVASCSLWIQEVTVTTTHFISRSSVLWKLVCFSYKLWR